MKLLNKEELKKNILKSILDQVYKKLLNNSLVIKEKIRQEHLRIWKNSIVYNELLHGDLGHQIGFYTGTAQHMVDTILEVFSRSLVIHIRKFRKKSGIYTGLKIEVLKMTRLIGLTDLDEAIIDTKNPATRRYLPWVQWLFFDGNKFLVYDYEYTPEAATRSRSGFGLMRRDDTEAWRIPPQFSGTATNNWVIRELEENIGHLNSFYGTVIEESINA